MATDEKKVETFSFHPEKWNSHTSHMDDETYRAYHQILCWMWIHSKDQSSFRDSDRGWKIATGITDEDKLARVRATIMCEEHPLLKRTGQGGVVLYSERLKAEYKGQAKWLKNAAEGGIKSAATRAAGRSTALRSVLVACSEVWKAITSGVFPFARAGKALRPLIADHSAEEIASALCNYLKGNDLRYATVERFAQTYGQWDGTYEAENAVEKEEFKA